MIITIGAYMLDVDVEKNNTYYQDERNAYKCDCDGCLNYLCAVSNISSDTKDLFCQMGLDIKKPAEVYDLDSKNNILMYGGWYHICGHICGHIYNGPVSSSDSSMEPIAENFEVKFIVTALY